MKVRKLTALTLAGTVLMLAACGDDDAAVVQSDSGAGSSAPANDTANGDTENEAASSTAGTSRSDVSGAPQDQDLDIELRHPGGTEVTLSSLRFDGDNVLVDLEFFNGSTDQVSLHNPTWDENALRLVDDEGNVYNFAQPEDTEGSGHIELAQGDRMSAELAFYGPLRDESDQLRLVTNVAAEHIDSWDADEEWATSTWPGFVVPIDLEWD